MSIVLDSNLLVAIAVRDTRAPAVMMHLERWLEAGEALHAPDLFRYEVANGLVRSVYGGVIRVEELEEAWSTVASLPIRFHSLTDVPRVARIALQLGRQSAYDASYIALAEELQAQLWTLDGHLYRNAVGLGFPVHLAA